MTGVGFAHDPDSDPTDDDEEIHLWKQISKNESETYCSELTVQKELSGMTQLTESTVENWENQENVCDECVQKVKNKYY
jgi:hypothetical protein